MNAAIRQLLSTSSTTDTTLTLTLPNVLEHSVVCVAVLAPASLSDSSTVISNDKGLPWQLPTTPFTINLTQVVNQGAAYLNNVSSGDITISYGPITGTSNEFLMIAFEISGDGYEYIGNVDDAYPLTAGNFNHCYFASTISSPHAVSILTNLVKPGNWFDIVLVWTNSSLAAGGSNIPTGITNGTIYGTYETSGTKGVTLAYRDLSAVAQYENFGSAEIQWSQNVTIDSWEAVISDYKPVDNNGIATYAWNDSSWYPVNPTKMPLGFINAGDAIVIAFSTWRQSGATDYFYDATITDNLGNTYSQLTQITKTNDVSGDTTNGHERITVYGTFNKTSGSVEITVNVSPVLGGWGYDLMVLVGIIPVSVQSSANKFVVTTNSGSTAIFENNIIATVASPGSNTDIVSFFATNYLDGGGTPQPPTIGVGTLPIEPISGIAHGEYTSNTYAGGYAGHYVGIGSAGDPSVNIVGSSNGESPWVGVAVGVILGGKLSQPGIIGGNQVSPVIGSDTGRTDKGIITHVGLPG